ncbi:MAG TPA: acetyl-coenzyme A synthetase, partial [Planctomycetaceae bacterium]|nr:acetyl-coenzyme A synthetase [Planctomycetaceae bacterium]
MDNVMHESRVFPPSAEFASRSRIGSMDEYRALYDRSIADPERFWGESAREELHWFEPFRTVFRRTETGVEWFPEGKTNLSYNCLDRHVAAGLGDRTAILWEGEPGDRRTLTYAELLRETERFANVLKSLGVVAGDRVSIYMPM